MTITGDNSIFSKLLEYEKRASGFTPGSKKGSGPADEWSGVVFGIAGGEGDWGESRIVSKGSV